jgi:multidrug efflux pump subunit AcrB
VPEVTDFQAYAGTAAPINFNGLVRQYYLRAQPEMGDIQVNLVGKHAQPQEPRDRGGGARCGGGHRQKHGGNAKVVEVPPGPPVLSPIVAEVYGPDYAGQVAVAGKLRAAFEATPDIVGVDDTVDEEAPKLVLRVNQARRRPSSGWPRPTSSRWCASASAARTSRRCMAATTSMKSRCASRCRPSAWAASTRCCR